MAKTISDYKTWILNTLLDKYEQSSAFRTGVFSRRILLTVPHETQLTDALEQVDEKHMFLTILAQLKNQGILDYSWVKYEAGNLVDQVWLLPDSLALCYREAGRTSAAELLDSFLQLMTACIGRFRPASDFSNYLDGVLEYAAVRKKIKAPFTEDMTFNANLLECLVRLDETPNQMERVFSSRLFGDSKYFERTLKSKVISILKELQKASIGSDEEYAAAPLSDESLLAARGLYRWPEIYELNGALNIHLDDGASIDTSAQTYGAYLNSDTVKHILSVDGSRIQRVVFIENKANYIDFQAHHKAPGDLILYHGGFYSPMKGLLFTKIYEGCSRAAFYHWSDIDLGGFRLFCRLKANIVPTLLPLFMDVDTLLRHADSWMEIKTPGYLQALSSMLDDPAYGMFSEVIRYMLDHRVRLEQENLIGSEGRQEEAASLHLHIPLS